ncbi:MAG: DNA alkylation repair protein [Lishizhenia sp.]
MELQEIMTFLKEKGSEQTRKIYKNHGSPENFYGVKVSDLKTIQKKVKKKHDLAIQLFATGNGDAMYLAGLISEPKKMTKKELQNWADTSSWYMISEYAVAWTVAESDFALELGIEWINGDSNHLKCIGYATLGSYIAITQDEDLEIDFYKQEVEKIAKIIHSSENRVRYTMNGFVIAVGAYIQELYPLAKEVGEKIGKVDVSLGKTACKVPVIKPYLENIETRGRLGKKRKTAKC